MKITSTQFKRHEMTSFPYDSVVPRLSSASFFLWEDSGETCMRTYENARPLSKPSSVNLQKLPAGFWTLVCMEMGPMLWISTSQKITWITCWMLAYRFLRSQHRWPLRTNLLMAMSQRRPKPPTRQHDEHMWEGRNLEVPLNFGWWDWLFNLTFFCRSLHLSHS